jgi:hypothetical protein
MSARLALLFFGEMKEDLDDARAVAVQMILHVHDGVVTLLPDVLIVAQLSGQALSIE